MSPNLPRTNVSAPAEERCRPELNPRVDVCPPGSDYHQASPSQTQPESRAEQTLPAHSGPSTQRRHRPGSRRLLSLGLLLVCAAAALLVFGLSSRPDPAAPGLISQLKDSLLANPLLGHESAVYSLAFSPDGRNLASAAADQTIILWDVRTRKPAATLSPAAKVACLTFSPDGTTLVAGTWDGSILLWGVDTWQSLGPPLAGHKDAVYHLAFSPDGHILASAGGDGAVILREFPNGRPLGPPLRGHSRWVADLAFSPQGHTLASAGGDGLVILWDIATRQPLAPPLQGHSGPVLAVVLSPDGTLVASGGDDQKVILWDMLTRQPRLSLTGFGSAVLSLAFSPDGQTLAAGTLQETIFLWNVAIQETSGVPLSRHSAAVLSLAFSPDGKTLASASEDKTVILWDLSRRSWLLRAYHTVTGDWRRQLGGFFSRRLDRDQPRPDPQVERAGK